MENFTPVSALIGGVLIGIAATLLLLFNGKILGVSGIIAQAISKPVSQSVWNLMFLVGLILGTILYRIVSEDRLSISIEASIPILIFAGLLVGFGTNLGSGCTSGHGVCGIARFSKRSIVATITFMISGVMTVYIVKHIVGS